MPELNFRVNIIGGVGTETKVDVWCETDKVKTLKLREGGKITNSQMLLEIRRFIVDFLDAQT